MRLGKLFFSFLLILMLVAIRYFEKQLFDDGLIDFFQYDYLKKNLPDISTIKVIWVNTIRFWINSIVSMAILLLLFPQKYLVEFLVIIYGLVFVVVIFLMYYFITHYQAGEYSALFYTRRILIQPILLFVLIPALLYQQRKKKS